MNPFKILQLKILGSCKDKGKYYIDCDIHGIQLAKEHGYDTIVCLKCLDDLVKSFRSEDSKTF